MQINVATVATSPSTLGFGDICRNLLEIHRCLLEIENKPQASSNWKMRIRVDHDHMQFKIFTTRCILFCHLKFDLCRKYRDKA